MNARALLLSTLLACVTACDLASLDSDDVHHVSSDGDGLVATYFDNKDLTAAKLERTDSAVDFAWGKGAPDGLSANTFSIRWVGFVEPRYSETYRFYVTSDDGARLWVDDQPLVDRWTNHGPRTYSGTIDLEAGERYPLVLEYYEDGGGAMVRLEWSSATQEREVVPTSQLFTSDQAAEAVIYEAEERTAESGCAERSNHAGYTGAGFMDYGGGGTWAEWNNIRVAQAGDYTLTFRYANGASLRPTSIVVNGEDRGSVPFAGTGAWVNWATQGIEVSLRAGANTIRLVASSSSGGPNLDHLALAGGDPVDDDDDDDDDDVAELFTIGFLPDTQHLTGSGSEDRKDIHFRRMLNYFVDRQDELNVQFVAHLGDMTHNGEATEWGRVDIWYDIFRDNQVPFSPCRGNHDWRHWINATFPVGDFSDKPWWGGNYGDNIENSYYLIDSGGQQFIVLVLDYFGSTDRENGEAESAEAEERVERWANDVLADHADRHAIVVSHNIRRYLDSVIRKHDNVFMAIMGHVTRDIHTTVQSFGGKTQHLFIFDYQKIAEHFKGSVVKHFTFRPARDEVEVRTWSADQQRYLQGTDCDSPSLSDSGQDCHRLTFDLEMD